MSKKIDGIEHKLRRAKLGWESALLGWTLLMFIGMALGSWLFIIVAGINVFLCIGFWRDSRSEYKNYRETGELYKPN